jgi:hypothetical protein
MMWATQRLWVVQVVQVVQVVRVVRVSMTR